MDFKGQLNPALVWTIIIMLVAIAIGGLVYSRLSDTMGSTEIATGRAYTTYRTVNPNIDDPDNLWGWDNFAFDSRETFGGGNGTYFMGTRGDDGLAGYTQSFEVLSLGDGVSSATVVFKYRVFVNDNIDTLELAAYFGTDGGELIWSSTDTEKTEGWVSIEPIDVSDLVTEAGTYDFYVQDTVTMTDPGSVVIGYDEAQATVTIYTRSMSENVLDTVNAGASTVFPLLVLMVVIAVLVSVVLIVKVLA